MRKKNFRLTMKTAKALVKREFGISPSALETEKAEGGVYIYKMMMGRFEITVENDWFDHNGCISLDVSSCLGESMRLYYDPETLEENFDAEDKNRAEIKEEYCEGCRWREQATAK